MTTSLTKNDEFLQTGLWVLTSNQPTKVFNLDDTLNKGVDKNLYNFNLLFLLNGKDNFTNYDKKDPPQKME